MTTVTIAEPRMLIGGELRDAATGAAYDNLDPATEEVLGVAADARPDDIDAAVAAARDAFDRDAGGWTSDPAFRRRCLEQLLDAMRQADPLLREVQTAEGGMPTSLTYTPTDFLAYWAGMATDYPYETELDSSRAITEGRRLLRREPFGVVAAITPWNFPMYINIAKIGPALAAGNTVVLKPAPDTPWCASLLGRLAAEHTDLPPGVLNVVTARDPAAGALLTSDPRVDMVSLTGSTVTGTKAMVSAAGTIKKVTLELGGKSAHILLDDADLAATIATAVSAVCLHSGQGCAWLTRLLLPRPRYEEGVELAAAATDSVTYGDPRDPMNIQGPLINATQLDRVLGYIASGIADGARLVTGGKRSEKFERGYFVEPTVFVDVDPACRIAQEETFGPVLCVLPYDTEDEAVALANGTAYGLSGAVSSADEQRALAVARRLRTGTVSVNGAPCFGPDIPMGGYRSSGVGRENGVQGFEEYLETKLIGLP